MLQLNYEIIGKKDFCKTIDIDTIFWYNIK